MSSKPCRESDSDPPRARPIGGLTQDQDAIRTMIFARGHSSLASLLPKIQPRPVADPTYLKRDPAPGTMRSLSRMPSSPCATRRPQSVPHALPRRCASPTSRTHIPAILLRTRPRYQRHHDETQAPAHVACAPNSLHGLSGRPPSAAPGSLPSGTEALLDRAELEASTSRSSDSAWNSAIVARARRVRARASRENRWVG